MVIILGFQRWFIIFMTYLIKPRLDFNILYDMLSLVYSVAILVAFIPIIKICAKYFPSLIGYRKI